MVQPVWRLQRLIIFNKPLISFTYSIVFIKSFILFKLSALEAWTRVERMRVRCGFWIKPQPEPHALGFRNPKPQPQPYPWFRVRFQNLRFGFYRFGFGYKTA